MNFLIVTFISVPVAAIFLCLTFFYYFCSLIASQVYKL